MVKQVSVFLENKPGRLEHALKVLADGGVNIVALTIAETSGFGLLRMLVDQPTKAAQALNSAGITSSETPVTAVEIKDTPGSLLAAVKGFKERNLNIEYLYTFTERHTEDCIVVIFRFENCETAERVLWKEGYKLLSHEQITGKKQDDA